MDVDAHIHKLFHDHWLDLLPIERSPRLRVHLTMTT